jgi:hypothetical protein
MEHAGDVLMSETKTSNVLKETTTIKIPCYYAVINPKLKERGNGANSLPARILIACQKISRSVGATISVIVRFVFEYLFVVALYDLFLGYFFSSARGSYKLKRSLEVWFVILTGALYGFFRMLQSHSYSLKYLFDSPHDIYVLFARASGKLATAFGMVGLLFTLRPLASALEEIPLYRRNYYGWRRVHILSMQLCMLFGLSHTIFQGLRIADYSTKQVYEDYFLYSGLVLWVLFLLQAAPNFFLSVAVSQRAAPFWKWLFRQLHVYLYLLVAVGYTAHSGSIFSIVLYMAWVYLRRQSELQLADHAYFAWGTGVESGTLHLLLQVQSKIPFEFGYYCQIEVAGVSASYTMIPSEVVTDSSNAHPVMQFIIKKSVFSEAFYNRIALETAQNSSFAPSIAVNGTEYRKCPVESVDLRVWGPFHSTNLSIRDKSNKRLVVLTGRDGVSVAESVISFKKVRDSFWEQLVVIQLCGRDRPSPESVGFLKVADGGEPLDLLPSCGAGVEADSAGVEEGWGSRKSRGSLGEALRESLVGESQSAVDERERRTAVAREHADAVWDHVASQTAPVRAYQLYGQLSPEMVLSLVRKIDSSSTHYLICGKMWYSLLQAADEYNLPTSRSNEGNFGSEMWTRVHNEDF